MNIYDIRNLLNAGKSIYEIPLRVTFYARVSTDSDEQLHSLSAQISYYSEMIRNNKNWEYVEGYIDEGLSGTSVKKRESFLRMIDDAKLKKFDFVITKEISRFARNTLDSLNYTQDLLKNGVGVLFQSDNINTLVPDAELRLTIMSSIAQDEVRKISERVKFGFKRAIENGVVLGNNKIWGYTKDNGKLVIDEDEAALVRLIFELYATKNMGMRGISKHLTSLGVKNGKGNDFSFSTLKGILTNPKYKGYYCGNKTHKFDYKLSDRKIIDQTEWVMYKDEENVPPIVSEEMWDRANLILAKRSAKQSSDDKTSYQNKYLYSGKIVCMEHNVNYHRACYKYKSGNKEVWQCKLYAEKGKEGCTSPTLYTTELNEIMKGVLDNLITDKAKIIHDLVAIYASIGAKTQIKEDLAKKRMEINNILKMKDKLLDLSIKGRISDDEFEARNIRFNDNIATIQIAISRLEQEDIRNTEVSASIETLRKLIANELEFENGVSNEVIESVLDRIEVYKTGDKNEVKLKIFLKMLQEPMDYGIKREHGKTSVCYAQHT